MNKTTKRLLISIVISLAPILTIFLMVAAHRERGYFAMGSELALAVLIPLGLYQLIEIIDGSINKNKGERK